MIKTLLTACAALALATPAFAAPTNTPVNATGAPAKAPAAAPTKAKGPATAPTTAAGKACSAQADAKGLHGEARKKFRSKCERGMKAPAADAAKPAATKPAATTAPKATSAPKR